MFELNSGEIRGEREEMYCRHKPELRSKEHGRRTDYRNGRTQTVREQPVERREAWLVSGPRPVLYLAERQCPEGPPEAEPVSGRIMVSTPSSTVTEPDFIVHFPTGITVSSELPDFQLPKSATAKIKKVYRRDKHLGDDFQLIPLIKIDLQITAGPGP